MIERRKFRAGYILFPVKFPTHAKAQDFVADLSASAPTSR